MIANGGRPAQGRPMLLGITSAERSSRRIGDRRARMMSAEDRELLDAFARRVRLVAPSAAIWAFGFARARFRAS